MLSKMFPPPALGPSRAGRAEPLGGGRKMTQQACSNCGYPITAGLHPDSLEIGPATRTVLHAACAYPADYAGDDRGWAEE